MLQEEEINEFLKERFKIYHEGNTIQIKVYNHLIEKLSSGNSIWELGYKYLCWLNYHNKSEFRSEINKPIVPTPITLSLDEFKNKFCTNKNRKDIYLHFLGYIKARVEEFQVDNLNVLIGGSFAEEENNLPNDIDCTILISKKIMESVVANHYDNYCVRAIMPVDVEFAVEDSAFKDYWYYSCLTHLGNKPEDKKSEYLKNNKFQDRKVFLITLSRESK